MSKVTLIFGTPRGAGMMPSRWKRPRVRLSRASARSPCRTWISTLLWLSSAVEKVSSRRVGMVVLRGISVVITPPSVSTPRRERGDVEQDHVLDVAGEHAGLDRRADGHDLVRVHALVRAPCRRTSSPSPAPAGCASSHRPAPPRRCRSGSCSRRSSAFLQGSSVRSTRSSIIDSSLARVSRRLRCFGPRGVGGQEGQVDRGLELARELDLRLLGRVLEALEDHLVARRRRCRWSFLNSATR